MQGLLILLFFLLLGTVFQFLFSLPIPESILGMLLLLAALMLRGRIPDSLVQISKTLSPLLPLFLIPVSAGIVTQTTILSEHGLVLLAILTVSLIPGILVCALIMRLWARSS